MPDSALEIDFEIDLQIDLDAPAADLETDSGLRRIARIAQTDRLYQLS